MKWANDVNPATDNYQNTEHDRTLVAQMCHRRLHGDDLIDVIGMLFGQTGKRVTK